ncbi:MAG: hypothetical protein KKD77_21175 [Gammaproteobacteria bacterium]|nr:hypothetical protein [Gammaproteobacteria bacterium]
MSRIEQWNEKDVNEKQQFMSFESRAINAQRPKSTLVHNTRLMPEDLATLAKFFIQQNEPIQGPSQVIRLACEVFAELLREKYPELHFSSRTEVMQFLIQTGIIKEQQRNAKKLARYASLEGILDREIPTRPPADDLELQRVAARQMIKMGHKVDPEDMERLGLEKGPGKDGEYSNDEMKRIIKQMREKGQMEEEE